MQDTAAPRGQALVAAQIAAYQRGLDDGRNGVSLSKEENPIHVWASYVRGYNDGLDDRRYWREWAVKRTSQKGGAVQSKIA